MHGVNRRRWIGGGLLAGLVLNLAHALAEGLTRREQQRMLERLGLSAPGEEAMVAVALGGFVVGLVAVWIYAAIRARYGGGTGTALRAAAAVWILICLFPNSALLAYGVFSPEYFGLALVMDLIIVPAGTLVGAWVYREDPGFDLVGHADAVHARA
jgi:hypothetical protein